MAGRGQSSRVTVEDFVNGSVTDSPASFLRALSNRVPVNAEDSFEAQPSTHRLRIRDLFSNANASPRRNSIDSSDLESMPRVTQRTRSLSDDERASPADTYNQLRARLNQSGHTTAPMMSDSGSDLLAQDSSMQRAMDASEFNSTVRTLRRMGSDASLSSRSDFKEQVDEQERERLVKREHMWNLPPNARQRTSSHPSPLTAASLREHSHAHMRERAESLQASASPTPILHRTRSRAGSSAGSVGTVSTEDEDERRERERNWGSARPVWHHAYSQSRSGAISPSGRSSPASARSDSSPKDKPGLSRSRTTPSPLPGGKRLRPVHKSSSFSSPSRAANSSSTPALSRNSTYSGISATGAIERTGSAIRIKPEGLDKVNRVLEHNKNADDKGTIRSWTFPSKIDSKAVNTMEKIVGRQTPSPPRSPVHSSPSRNRPSFRQGSPSPSRPGSRNGTLRASQIPVRSPTKSKAPLPEEGSKGSIGRGHKRTVTELHQSQGKIPPKVVDEHTLRAEKERQEERARQALADGDTPPAESTPTVRTLSIGDASGASSEFMSFSRSHGVDPAAHPSIVVEEASSPEKTQWSALATPPKPRRQSFGSARVEYQTPSPPKGMPELPGPPSSEDEIEEERTPVMGYAPLQPDFTATKTPRPPGAWLATPAGPMKRDDEALSPIGVLDGFITPETSLGLPTRTPAPPGAWAITPAMTERKSILKVRFDAPEQEVSMDSSIMASPNGQALNARLQEAASRKRSSTPPGVDVPLPPSPDQPKRTKTPEPSTPVGSLSKAASRKSPGIRMLDAFGRETNEASMESIPQVSSDSIRGKSPVRMVNAMGHEVDDVEPSSSDMDIPKLSRLEATKFLRDGVDQLARDLDDSDWPSNDSMSWMSSKVVEIQKNTRVAAELKVKLNKALDQAASLDAQILQRKSHQHKQAGRSSLFWKILCLANVIILLYLYRLSHARAYDLFLTRYYDPFYGELHRYTHIDDYSTDKPWNFSSIPDTLRQEGLTSVCTHVYRYIATWHRAAWAMWSDESRDIPHWPPA